ncbi:MAG: immune inhibitor A [Chitinophagaceae bacterium]|nr:immune inhibitor A [Chitinophagaceae bacterium]
MPAKAIINKVPNGTKIWTTNLDNNYSDNETSYLVSPCFDLTGLRNPVLSFSHIFDIEQDYDYTWVEYSTDGKTWNKLGNVNQGTNWYDNAVDINWRLSNKKWHVASIDVPVTNATVHFRFAMSSDAGVTQEGVGIDDIHIHEKYEIPGNPGGMFTSSINTTASNNWISNLYGDDMGFPGYIYTEINTRGQNLGTLQIDPLKNLGPVRFSNNQYYIGRNFSIHPGILPTDTVDLRLYFTDVEVNEMINAGNCPGCPRLNDAYELGITNYTGAPAEENVSLDDNLAGYYNFIVPGQTKIIPFGSGYYAEFSLANLGEFWISKGNIAPAASNLCPATTFALTTTLGTTYQWQVNTGAGYTNITDGTFIPVQSTAVSSLSTCQLPTQGTSTVA